MLGGLGKTEVNYLGNGVITIDRYQDVVRFQITMNDSLLMRMLYCMTDRKEQAEPLVRGEFLLVAILGNGDSFDQIHYEI